MRFGRRSAAPRSGQPGASLLSTDRSWAAASAGLLGVMLANGAALAGDAGLDCVRSAVLGDFNGDGTADIAVGFPNEKVDEQVGDGVVRVFDGVKGAVIATLRGPIIDDPRVQGFGTALACVGDVDRDGAADLAVSANGPADGPESIRLFSVKRKVRLSAIRHPENCSDCLGGMGSEMTPIASRDGVDLVAHCSCMLA